MGLDDVTIHDLRRTCASWLTISGDNIAVISTVLNHTTLANTAIYARLNQAPVKPRCTNMRSSSWGVAVPAPWSPRRLCPLPSCPQCYASRISAPAGDPGHGVGAIAPGGAGRMAGIVDTDCEGGSGLRGSQRSPVMKRTRMSKLDSLHQTQHTQQLGAAVLNEVSILRREQTLSQQGVNGFAGTNEINGLFSNSNHTGFSLRTR